MVVHKVYYTQSASFTIRLLSRTYLPEGQGRADACMLLGEQVVTDCTPCLQVSAGCRYAFTACMAVAFFQNKYSTEGSHEVALLPIIDLLNHNSTNQVCQSVCFVQSST